LLLVYWSPDAVFCETIAPDLARLQNVSKQRNVQLVLLGSRDAEGNRKLSRTARLALPDPALGETPVLKPFFELVRLPPFLLDPEGRMAKPLAHGADKVPRWPNRRQNNSAQSRIVRDGIKSWYTRAGVLASGVASGTYR